MHKIVSQLDPLGYFIGTTTADESPLEPGVFHMPAGAVDLAAPTPAPGKRHRLEGAAWIAEDLPPPPAQEFPTPPAL